MAKIFFSRTEQTIYWHSADGVKSWDCKSDFFPGTNDAGQPRESLPIGFYVVSADEPPAENSPAYGTFYITTGDARGRDIHGGGSDLPDPFASRQGWEATYGCIRMQNEDGEELSRLIIDAGNAVPLEVVA